MEEAENETKAQKENAHGCLPVQFVAAIDMSENPFASFKFDGVLGLGLVALSQTPAFNFFDVAAESAAWGPTVGFERTFSVFLGTSDNEDSTVTFGGYRPEVLHNGSTFDWVNVLEPELGYWQIDLVGLKANGEHVDFCDDGTCRAIADTGTSLLAIPSALGPQLVDKMRFTNQPGFKCNGPGPLLELSLASSQGGTFVVELEAKDFSRPEFVKDLDSERNNGTDGHDGNATADVAPPNYTCIPMLMHLDLPEPLSPKTFVLGEPVLQKYYTAFNQDPEKPRIGFALAKHHDAKILVSS
jgi:hypothetical protein